MRRYVALILAGLFFVLGAFPTLAQGDTAEAIDWLKEQVRADGGFTDGFSEESGVSPTTDALFAALSAGKDVSTWGELSPLDYLVSQARDATGTGPLAKLILAAKATGQDPTAFGGVDLVARLQATRNEESGQFEGMLTDHAFAMLALHQVGETIPESAVTALVDYQDESGGWSFDGTSQADTNTTALAVQALVAAGESPDSEAVSKALDFLRNQQNEDGGFPYQSPSEHGTSSDANSTAWVIQALLATDQDLEAWNDPQNFLASLQTDEGAFEWQADQGANFLATAQAVPALEGVSFVELPVVNASQTPTEEAPESLPETGNATPWHLLVVAGLLLLGGGRLAGPVVARYRL